MGPWRDDGSREAGQAHAVRRGVRDNPPAVGARPLVAFGHEQREPVVRVVLDPVEVLGGVSVMEVARSVVQVLVEVLHDVLDGQQQPFARRDLTNAVAGVLHRPA